MQKKDEKKLLSEWRQSKWEELDKTLKTLTDIRDDSKVSARDRKDAALGVAKMLGSVSPDSVKDKRPETPAANKEKVELTEDEWNSVINVSLNKPSVN